MAVLTENYVTRTTIGGFTPGSNTCEFVVAADGTALGLNGNFDYKPVGANSNTFIRRVIEGAGGTVALPEGTHAD